MNRRNFLAAAALQAPRKYRAVLIGHTGRGNFGHEWDTAFQSFPQVEVLAVADPVETGRAKAQARSGAARAYADYREMLDKERPDLVAVCPRSPVERLAMFTAAAERRAHIIVEKPFAASLEDADRMEALARKHGVKAQVGHAARPDPVTLQALAMIRNGAIGQVQEIRARGKEDRRAGGEDMIVLGTHCFDMMRQFAGDPLWVSAHVSEKGRDITRASGREATEPLGKVAGDNIAARFGFAGGVHAYFASKGGGGTGGERFGVIFYGSKGAISIPLSAVPNVPAQILRSGNWSSAGWEAIEPPAGTQGKPRGAANARMVADLLEAIERGRDAACNARDGRWAIEMVMGVYQSHLRGSRVEFPLRDRKHPLV